MLAFMIVAVVGGYMYISSLPEDYSFSLGGAVFTKRSMTIALVVCTPPRCDAD